MSQRPGKLWHCFIAPDCTCFRNYHFLLSSLNLNTWQTGSCSKNSDPWWRYLKHRQTNSFVDGISVSTFPTLYIIMFRSSSLQFRSSSLPFPWKKVNIFLFNYCMSSLIQGSVAFSVLSRSQSLFQDLFCKQLALALRVTLQMPHTIDWTAGLPTSTWGVAGLRQQKSAFRLRQSLQEFPY